MLRWWNTLRGAGGVRPQAPAPTALQRWCATRFTPNQPLLPPCRASPQHCVHLLRDPNAVIPHDTTGAYPLMPWEGSQAITERMGLPEVFAVIVLHKEGRLYAALYCETNQLSSINFQSNLILVSYKYI